MSKNYTASNQNGNVFFNGILGIILTCVIFVVLPAMHLLGNINSEKRDIDTASADDVPPPPPPEEPPPPPEEKDELDKPEMEEPPPPMTLEQLEMALNPGAGGAMGDFGFGDFDTGIDVLKDMQIFDLKDLDKPPRALFQIKPNYPYALKQAQIGGYCTVEWIIDENGKVLKARAIRASHREFERPAVEAIMRSKWKPGRKNNKDVATRVRQRIEFNP